MTRIYHELECGCEVSCDSGGALIPCDFLEEDRNPDCKAQEWIAHHQSCSVCGKCLTCYDHSDCEG